MHGLNMSPALITMIVVAFLTALTVHEYAHARAALAAGDDTAKLSGRISLNPIDHLDPVGTIFIALAIFSNLPLIGWGKPVPVNPFRFKNPRWDGLKVALWGPLSNLIFAGVLAIALRLVVIPLASENILVLTVMCIQVNLGLAFFNLLPIPPLDGSRILSALLPVETARRFDYTIGRYGMIILMALFVMRIPSMVIGPPIDLAFRVLTGFNL